MYELYYSPAACSLAIHTILLELDQKVTLHNVSIAEGKNKTPEYRKIHPLGSVPVLVDDGFVIIEGAAQIQYLLEKHGSPMLPKEGKARATALQWLSFCNATLHPVYSKAFAIMRTEADESARKPFMEAAIKHMNAIWRVLNEHLNGKAFLCGEQITGADILMAVIANWSVRMPLPVVLGEEVERVIRTVIARPTFQQAIAAEGTKYSVLAA